MKLSKLKLSDFKSLVDWKMKMMDDNGNSDETVFEPEEGDHVTQLVAPDGMAVCLNITIRPARGMSFQEWFEEHVTIITPPNQPSVDGEQFAFFEFHELDTFMVKALHVDKD
jgi:hypothetical protein